ncbi:MAG: NAD(P)H-quinone oxidoreductase [Polyangiaceae bacterium]|nr:NAD(P)H-quinone oxidoreductase [Polyangiaceae bacterium]
MRAIVIVRPAGPTSKGELELRHVPMPEPGPGQVRVRVSACAVNRADLLQVAGRYPAPPDAPADIPGLEIAGEVDAIGAGVSELAVGDRVFGVVGGGAYAEAIVVHARTLAAIPAGIDFVQAAAIPEAFVTAYDAVVLQAGLSAGEVLLVHAVGSGVGTAAVQIAKAIGARAIGTARAPDKLARARELGLAAGVVPEVATDRSVHFASKVREAVGGRGVDVVLELVGGRYVPESLASLESQGRLVLVGLLAGARAEIDLGMVLGRRLRIVGTVLRSRPIEEKMIAGQVLARHIAPLVASGALHAVVDRAMPIEKAAEAHAYVATNEGFGKVVLTM